MGVEHVEEKRSGRNQVVLGGGEERLQIFQRAHQSKAILRRYHQRETLLEAKGAKVGGDEFQAIGPFDILARSPFFTERDQGGGRIHAHHMGSARG